MATLNSAKRATDTSSGLQGPNPNAFTISSPTTDMSVANRAGAAADSMTQTAANMMINSIGKLGETGSQAIQDYALFSLEDAQTENMAAFLDSKKNPERAEEALTNATQLNKAEEGLWANFGNGTAAEDVNHITDAFDREMGKYQKAVDQGVMSVAEFENRVLQTTREHIRRFPGLSNQLLGHSDKILQISGMYGMKEPKEAEDEEAKRAMKFRDDITKALIQRNIRFDPSETTETLLRKYNDYADNFSAYQMVQQKAKEGEILTEQEGKAFSQVGGPAMTSGAYANFVDSLQNVIGASDKDYAGTKLYVTNFAAAEKLRYRNEVRALNVPPATSQQWINDYDTLIDGVVGNYDKYQSGEDLVAGVRNKTDFLKYSQETSLRQSVDVSTWEFLSKLPDQMTAWIQKDQKNEALVYNLIGAMVGQSLRNPSIGVGMSTQSLTAGKYDTVSAAGVIINSGDTVAFTDSVASMRVALDGLGAKNPQGVVKFLDNLMEDWTNPNTGKMLRDLSVPESAVSDITYMLDEYLRQVITSKNSAVYKEMHSLSNLAKGAINAGLGTNLDVFQGVKASVLPDGTLNYESSSDPDLASRLNKNISRRYNNAMRVYASLLNTTTKEASRMMFNRYADSMDIEKASFSTVYGEPTEASQTEDSFVKK